MKFSYLLLKKLIPCLKSKKQAVDVLTDKVFETDDLGEDVLDVGVSPNRFSDAASHFGLAKELAVALNLKHAIPEIRFSFKKNAKKNFSCRVEEPKICPRYLAAYFEGIRFAETPAYIKKALDDCGLRPINPIVDIMNYAMLETGQPLHAFDFDKLSPEGEPVIRVRKAKKNERIITLDNRELNLDSSMLVIADAEKPLAIAGIKGGKDAEVNQKTERIIVEAANFERSGIYKTAQALKLSTDASLRFSHDISPELAALGLARATALLKEVCGAKLVEIKDVKNFRTEKRVIAFTPEKINRFLGSELSLSDIKTPLVRLGFKIKMGKTGNYLAEPPVLRPDVQTFEDLAEEVVRIHGLNLFPAKSPHVRLASSGYEDQITLRDKMDHTLLSAGFSRVRNYSFLGNRELEVMEGLAEGEVVEVENPISDFSRFLRPSLGALLKKNAEDNLRFFEEVKIFEIGNVFFKQNGKIKEKTNLGIVMASNKGTKNFFEIKGIVEFLLKKIGISDFDFRGSETRRRFFQSGAETEIYSGNEKIGVIGQIAAEWNGYEAAFAELYLDVLLRVAQEENAYLPIPKFPSSMRDISVLISTETQIGEIMRTIQLIDPKLIADVDLIDEYTGKNMEGNRALTFRIVFQAEDRTLTEYEINDLMEKITGVLKTQFNATIR